MRAALFLLACAACGSSSSPARDASVAVDGSTIDADLRTCAAPGDCPCFTNYDCPATHACVSQDPSGTMVSCVLGPRGTGVAGAPCTGEGDCASALCVDDALGGLRCSDLCTTSATCPAELPRCLAGIGICARNP